MRTIILLVHAVWLPMVCLPSSVLAQESPKSLVDQVYHFNLERAQRCLNEFQLVLRVESDRSSEGLLVPRMEDSPDGRKPVFHPLGEEAFRELAQLEVNLLGERPVVLREVYWATDKGEIHIGHEYAVRFAMVLPDDLPEQGFPLTPANAAHPTFAEQIAIMQRILMIEARSSDQDYFIFETWGVPVRFSCQRHLAGISVSN